MKVIDKAKYKKDITKLQNEKKILLENSHPFIVDLHYVFETSTTTYFMMDFVRPGDLY